MTNYYFNNHSFKLKINKIKKHIDTKNKNIKKIQLIK